MNRMGKSSVQLFWQMYSTNGNTLLFTCLHTFAFVDVKMRSLYTIPNTVHEALGEVTPVVNQTRFTPQQRPKDKCHTTTYKIVWSDVDFQFHTNQAQYVKIAMDAASEACFSGKLKTFEDDLGRYCINQLKTRYVAESKHGDTLSIFTWVDDTDDCILHLEMEKQLGTVVFQALLKFYTNEDLYKSRM